MGLFNKDDEPKTEHASVEGADYSHLPEQIDTGSIDLKTSTQEIDLGQLGYDAEAKSFDHTVNHGSHIVDVPESTLTAEKTVINADVLPPRGEVIRPSSGALVPGNVGQKLRRAGNTTKKEILELAAALKPVEPTPPSAAEIEREKRVRKLQDAVVVLSDTFLNALGGLESASSNSTAVALDLLAGVLEAGIESIRAIPDSKITPATPQAKKPRSSRASMPAPEAVKPEAKIHSVGIEPAAEAIPNTVEDPRGATDPNEETGF